MTVNISRLFGLDIYTTDAEYRGKVFDLVINLEKGRVETITTEPLRVKSKQEAKKIITEKSVPYRNVRAVKDIMLVGKTPTNPVDDEEEQQAAPVRPKPAYLQRYRR